MDPLRILKALSNPHRLDIILWLKQPRRKNSVYKFTLKLLSISPNSVSVKVFKSAVVYLNLPSLHL